jgi:hypothetical protein
MSKLRFAKAAGMVATVPAIVLLGAMPAQAITGPFTWESESWCPSYHDYTGDCNTTQSPIQFSVSFAPSQVSLSGSPFVVDLAMNASATESGADNTLGYETWAPTSSTSVTVTEELTLPCNSSGQIYNWPAFWMVGTVGSWPTDGEIDIAEAGGTGGGGGVLTWSYHFTNPQNGDAEVITGAPSGNWCGTNTYSVTWSTSAVTISWNGTQVADITASASVPIVSDPMYVINDYGASTTYAGPVQGGETMVVDSFSES